MANLADLFVEIAWHLRPWLPLSRNERETRLAYLSSESEWFVELNGRRIARLTDARFEEMFWWNFKVESLSTEADIEAFYRFENSYQFVHVKTALVADALTSGRYLDAEELRKHRTTGRVIIRGLYIYMAPLTPWEKFILFRRKNRRPDELRRS